MELDTVLDKDMRDDMLKLVRFKVLFVRREYEVAFPEKEDLVPDNISPDAFTAWKVAEFIQDLRKKEISVPARWKAKKYPSDEYIEDGYLLGFPEADKKYLRVYFEVLDRYPREKFKFEEEQIRVLEQIRDRVSEVGGVSAELPDPYSAYANYFNLSAPVFAQWRKDVARCAKGMSKSLADIFNTYRDIGQISPPNLSQDAIFKALLETKAPFNRATFDRFTGRTEDKLILYAPQDKSSVAAPPGHSWWGEAKEDNGQFFQKITGSNYQHINPEGSKAVWDALAKTQVDLIYNAYTPDLGIVSWSMFRENHDNQLRSIGYEIDGALLWINEMLNPDGTKTTGPLPNVQPPQIVTPNQFIISIDFAVKEGADTYFCVYALHIDLDFKKCSAEFAGRILEMKNLLISGLGA